MLKSTLLVFATCLRYESGSFFPSLLGSTMAKEIDQNLLVLNRQGLGRVEDVYRFDNSIKFSAQSPKSPDNSVQIDSGMEAVIAAISSSTSSGLEAPNRMQETWGLRRQ